MNHPFRDLIKQEFLPKALLVGITPTPLGQAAQQSAIMAAFDTIVLAVPSTAANVVWFGDSSINVAAQNGLELTQGNPVLFQIINERPLYEVQAPLVDSTCQSGDESIPFKVWDPSTMYLVAAAPTTVGILFFKGTKF